MRNLTLLKTPKGKITANGWLQSYAAGGNTRTVSIDATGDIKTDLISTVASNERKYELV